MRPASNPYGSAVICIFFMIGCADDDDDGAPAGGSSTGVVTSGGAESSGETGDTPSDGSVSGGGSSSTSESADDGSGSSSGIDPSTPLGLYCEAADAYALECGDALSGCDLAVLETCNATYGIEREEVTQARASCGMPTPCEGIASFDVRHCVWEGTQNLQPTQVQLDLANALCASCFPDDATCLDNFFFFPEPFEGGATAGGVGSSYVRYDDPFVETLLESCVPAPGAPNCVDSYLSCLNGERDEVLPPEVAAACTNNQAPV